MAIYTNVTQRGNSLLVRERNTDGTEIRRKAEDFSPTFYIHSAQDAGYTDVLRKKNLQPKTFDGIEEAKQFLESYGQSSNVSIYGMSNMAMNYIQQQYDRTELIDKKAIRIGFIDIEVDSADGFPHPELAAKAVDALTYYDSFDDIYYTWGLGEWDQGKSILNPEVSKKVSYLHCQNEQELLLAFIAHLKTNCPDIITGWNSNQFDMLYLYNRIKNKVGEKTANSLSPWNVCKLREKKNKFGKKEMSVDIVGINLLDYHDVYRKHTLKMRPDYKLGSIAAIELQDDKLSYEEEGSLHQLAKINFQKYIDYNIKDVDIVLRLDQKLKLLDLVIDLAYVAGINYNDTFSPLRIWDGMIYDHLLKDKIVIPIGKFDEDSEKADQFEGAYVKTPQKGRFKWVISFDLTSLYPMIIQQWNLGNDTLVEGHVPGFSSIQGNNIVDRWLSEPEWRKKVASDLKSADMCLAMNGTLYRNDHRSFMADLMGQLFVDRKNAKSKMIDAKKKMTGLDKASQEYKTLKSVSDSMGTREKAVKVVLNSGFGAMGNPWFRFFDLRIAEAVTITGQLVTKWVEQDLNIYLSKILKVEKDRCLYIDTDSVYMVMDEIVSLCMPGETDEAKICGFLDTIAEKMKTDVIEKAYVRLQTETNCLENKMEMKREAIASAAFWKAKKKYALRVLNSEGVSYLDKPDMKIMGLESVSSKIPTATKKAIEKSIELILTKENDDLLAFIAQYKKEFEAFSLEEIAEGSSVNNLGKYEDSRGNILSGCPAHVRAAILYNQLIISYNIDKRFAAIGEGEKMKYLPLKLPNPVKSNVIGFSNYFPREFADIAPYIDRDALFGKTFLGPVHGMCQAVGWNSEETNDLSDFFA